ncbi:SHOCT domain-containing protein [Nocardiopsis suaedae]|uniref:SHOCT domain-containing protein n=1 Tax=Nocardiopsis suaedae TaxID=3018444 RepID=A0ABT4TQU3_9ACTN|nr:SHOCT domain-containing protein [Nocardiopsis suaedae]MDA2807055.1 SHOCT domain-containing protein [Nocardiopsis suaedae]
MEWAPEHTGTVVAMMMVLGLIVVAAMAATMAWLVAMAVYGGRGPDRPVVLSEEAGRLDPALDELRHRYARGEIGREEYLQRKIDLETDWD